MSDAPSEETPPTEDPTTPVEETPPTDTTPVDGSTPNDGSSEPPAEDPPVDTPPETDPPEEIPSPATPFVSKPVLLQAVQFTGGPSSATPITNWILSQNGYAAWAPERFGDQQPDGGRLYYPEMLTVRTPEGARMANVGNWIGQNSGGEFYVYSDDEFKDLYELKTVYSDEQAAQQASS